MRSLKVRFLLLAALALICYPVGTQTFAAGIDESVSVSEYLNSHDAIGQAQGVLFDQGYYYGPASERLNHHTRKALKEYQADHGLAQTGDFDEATARMMGLIRPGTNQYADSVAISRAQEVLREANYYNHSVNGVLDRKTERAIKKYQDKHDLNESGHLNAPTAESMGITVVVPAAPAF